MYARFQTTTARPETGDPDKLVRSLTDMISAHPGYAGLALLERDDKAGALITLWHTREDAELASERSRAAAGPRPVALQIDEIYEIDDDVPGPAAAQPAVAALVGYFDGPLSPAQVDAARRRGRERIIPVLRQSPALVRTLVLWHPTAREAVVVHLATSAGGLQEVVTTVTSVPISPEEDPALLPGPNLLEPHRVLAYEPVPVVDSSRA